MQPCTTSTGDEQDLKVQKAIRELENVISTRGRCLYRTAYRFLGNVADAEDAVQDALLSAYKHLGGFRGDSQMLTWLTAIVNNCARIHLRKRSICERVTLDDPIGEGQSFVSEHLTDPGPSPEDECRRSELSTRVTGLLGQLSPFLRKTFELRDLDGLKTSEAARILGVTEGTVKAQLSRARTKMRFLVAQMLDGRQPRVGRKRNRVGRRKPCSSRLSASRATLVTASRQSDAHAI